LKEKYLWGGIVAIILSWALNYTYFKAQQLDEPIFLEHYYETYIHGESQLTFYYLTNKQNPAEVVSVSVDGLEGVTVYDWESGFSMWEEQPSIRYEQEYRHHYLKSVTLQFQEDSLPQLDLDSSFSFEKMEVFFNNGSSMSADIGHVNFYSNEDFDQGAFNSIMSSSSNQHRSEEAMVTKEALIIEKISVPFTEELSELVSVKLDFNQEKLKELEKLNQGGDISNWVDADRDVKWEETSGISIDEGLLPLELEDNEWLNLKLFFNPERSSYFEFAIKMEGKTESGKPFVHHSHIIDQPYFDQMEIDRLIAEKEGGK
jgi:hypothetical protein